MVFTVTLLLFTVLTWIYGVPHVFLSCTFGLRDVDPRGKYRYLASKYWVRWIDQMRKGEKSVKLFKTTLNFNKRHDWSLDHITEFDVRGAEYREGQLSFSARLDKYVVLKQMATCLADFDVSDFLKNLDNERAAMHNFIRSRNDTLYEVKDQLVLCVSGNEVTRLLRQFSTSEQIELGGFGLLNRGIAPINYKDEMTGMMIRDSITLAKLICDHLNLNHFEDFRVLDVQAVECMTQG
jgi:hypothetical protein